MVDSIGSRPPRDTLTAVAGVAKVQPARAQPGDTARAELELSAVAFDFDKFADARAAKVNEQHVEAVRRAVRDGTYPILPETIADRLLALKLDWSPKK